MQQSCSQQYQVGHDGKTPYARLFGKDCRDEGYEFGEQVHFRRRQDGIGSLGARWGPRECGSGADGEPPHTLWR